MSGLIEIPASERGRVRVFALSAQLSAEMADTGEFDGLFAALGVKLLHGADIQIVTYHDIKDMGLVSFLVEAYGVEADEIASHAEELNALTGEVAILRSGAFGQKRTTLITDGEARLMATLTEPNPARPPLEPLISKTAAGSLSPQSSKPKPSDAAMSGRIAMAVLIFLGLFVWLLIRIAG